MSNQLYKEMTNLRGQDLYPDNELENYLVEAIFPKDSNELAIKLSNVTSAFYGLTLKHVGLQCGWDKVDSVSKSLFKELGQLKTREALENNIKIEKDTRGLAQVLISAIFTSSPKYKFSFKKYTPQETIVNIIGTCRYYDIAKKIDIEKNLTWPTLIPFFEGIAEELGIKCDIDIQINKLEENYCHYVAVFKAQT
ncbi:hypothetical protein ACFLZV_06260 [Candidatus Margulisiibacteriota bacterium]